MMEDKRIHKLIDLAVIDNARRDLYHDALPKMTADERLQLMLFLWSMLMAKLDAKIKNRMEEMIEEMATKEDVEYSKDDFKQVEKEVVNEFLAAQSGIEDEDELEALRQELDQIGAKVEEHDEVLSEIAKKFSS